MLKFIHLTDPHLAPAPRTLYALDPRERLARAVDDINRRQPDAAFVVVTGDLAHLGEAAAYAELRTILGRLAVPCHLLIGNHDSRAAFPDAPRDENGFVQYVVETPLTDCVMLDSVVEGDHGGLLCERRLAWLERVLAERAGRAAEADGESVSRLPVNIFCRHREAARQPWRSRNALIFARIRIAASASPPRNDEQRIYRQLGIPPFSFMPECR